MESLKSEAVLQTTSIMVKYECTYLVHMRTSRLPLVCTFSENEDKGVKNHLRTSYVLE